MSSDLQPVVEGLLFNNYVAVAIATAVAYDYIITFTEEIEYIWNRPWTFVTCMFVVVRYLGLILAMIDAFFGSTLMPGPILIGLQLLMSLNRCMVIFLLRVWGFIIFLAATEFVMILRVHVLYGQSKLVLSVLLVFYAVTLVIYSVSGGYYNNPDTHLTMTIAEVLDMSFCNPTYTGITHDLGVDKLIPRLILVGLLIILSVARFCAESYQMYKATKQWKVNQYINLLTKQGVLYFIGHLLYVIDFGPTIPGQLMTMISIIVMYILPSRFIIGVRELYLRNIHQWDEGVDTGFGVWKVGTSPTQHSFSVEFTSDNSASTEVDVEMQALEITWARNANDAEAIQPVE